MATGWRYFSVKTVYVARAKGRPRKRNAAYDSRSVMVEERIILLKARSHDEAIRRAEAEAERYLGDESSHTNPYGQEVVWTYEGLADSFELFAEKIESGAEIFSSTRVLPADPGHAALGDLLLGPNAADDQDRRLKFLNSEISGLL